MIDNFKDFRLQVLESLYTVAQGEFLELMRSNDQFAFFQDLFARRPAQFQLPKVIEAQIW